MEGGILKGYYYHGRGFSRVDIRIVQNIEIFFVCRPVRPFHTSYKHPEIVTAHS